MARCKGSRDISRRERLSGQVCGAGPPVSRPGHRVPAKTIAKSNIISRRERRQEDVRRRREASRKQKKPKQTKRSSHLRGDLGARERE
jgi:hypothetical protein